MYTSGGKCGKGFQPNHSVLANLPLVENVPWAFLGQSMESKQWPEKTTSQKAPMISPALRNVEGMLSLNNHFIYCYKYGII